MRCPNKARNESHRLGRSLWISTAAVAVLTMIAGAGAAIAAEKSSCPDAQAKAACCAGNSGAQAQCAAKCEKEGAKEACKTDSGNTEKAGGSCPNAKSESCPQKQQGAASEQEANKTGEEQPSSSSCCKPKETNSGGAACCSASTS